MLKQRVLPANDEWAGRDLPAFVSHLDAMDKRAYRRAIERWEAEGGAVPRLDGEVPAAARGMRRARRSAAA